MPPPTHKVALAGCERGAGEQPADQNGGARARTGKPPESERAHSTLGARQVGIEDCLHIEFEYNKSRYHLRDVVHGKIFFLLVRIKIKNMEVAIIRRESAAAG